MYMVILSPSRFAPLLGGWHSAGEFVILLGSVNILKPSVSDVLVITEGSKVMSSFWGFALIISFISSFCEGEVVVLIYMARVVFGHNLLESFPGFSCTFLGVFTAILSVFLAFFAVAGGVWEMELCSV
jgi:hypothetical protein